MSELDVGRSQGCGFMSEADIGRSQSCGFRKNGRVKLEATRKVDAPSFSFVRASISDVDSLCGTHTTIEAKCVDYVSECHNGKDLDLRRSTSSSMGTDDGYNGEMSVATHDVDCRNGDGGCGTTLPSTDEGNQRFVRRMRRQRSAPEMGDVDAIEAETREIETGVEDIPRQRIRRRRDTQEEVDGLSEKRLERLNRLRRRKKDAMSKSTECDSTGYAAPRERQSMDDKPRDRASDESGIEHQASTSGVREVVKTDDVVCEPKIKSILKKHELAGDVATSSGEPATQSPKRKAKSVRVRRHDSFIKADSDMETPNESKDVAPDLSLEQASANADAEDVMNGPEGGDEVEAFAHRFSRMSRAEFYQCTDDYYLTLPRCKSETSVSAVSSDACDKNPTSTRRVRSRTRNRFSPEPDDNSRVLEPSETNVSAASLDVCANSRAARVMRFRTRTRSAPEPDNNVLEPSVMSSTPEDRNSLFEPHGMSSEPDAEDIVHIFEPPCILSQSEDNSHVFAEPEGMSAAPEDNSLVFEPELKSTVPDDNFELFESECIPITADYHFDVFESHVRLTMPEDNSHVIEPQGTPTMPEDNSFVFEPQDTPTTREDISNVFDAQDIPTMPGENSDVIEPQGIPTILEDKSCVFELCLMPADQSVRSLSPCRTASEGSDRSGRLDSHVYQSYAAGILRSSRKSGKFLRLQKQYANLERIANIENETLTSNSELGRRRYNVLDLRYKSLGSLEPTSAAETLVLSKYKLDSLWELKELFADLDEAQDDGEFLYDIGNLDEMQWNPWNDWGLGGRAMSMQELRQLYEAGENLNERSDRRRRRNPRRVFRRGVGFSELREKYVNLGANDEVTRETHQGGERRGSDGSISSQVSAVSGSYIQIMENAAKKAKQRPLYGYHIVENPNRYEEHVRMMKSPSCPDLQGGNDRVDRFKRADLRRITERHADVQDLIMTHPKVVVGDAMNMQLRHGEERSRDMKVDVTVEGLEGVGGLHEESSDVVEVITNASDEGRGATVGLSGSGDGSVGACDDGEEYPTVDAVRRDNESEEPRDECDSPGKQGDSVACGTSVMQGNMSNSAFCHDGSSAMPQGPPRTHPANRARSNLKLNRMPFRERSATNEETGEKDDVVATPRVMKWRAEVRGLLGVATKAVASKVDVQSDQGRERRQETSNVPTESHSSATNPAVGRTSGERRTWSARGKQNGETIRKTYRHKSSKPEPGVVSSVLSLFQNMEGQKRQVFNFKNRALTKSALQGSTQRSILNLISDSCEKKEQNLVARDCSDTLADAVHAGSDSLRGAVHAGIDSLAGAVHAGSVPFDTGRAKKSDLNVSDDVKIINGNLSGQTVSVMPSCEEPASKSPVKDVGIELGKDDFRMFASTGILKQSSSVQGTVTGISEDRQAVTRQTWRTDVECGESLSEFCENYDDHLVVVTKGEICGDADNNPPMLTRGRTTVNYNNSWQHQIVGDPPTGVSNSLDVPYNRNITRMSMSPLQNSTGPKSRSSFVPGGKCTSSVRNATSAKESLGMDNELMELAAMKYQMTNASSSRNDVHLIDNGAFSGKNTEVPAVMQPSLHPQYLSSPVLDESGVPPVRNRNFHAYQSEGNLDRWPSTSLRPITGNSSTLHSSNETMIVMYSDPDLSVGSQNGTSPSVKEMTSRYEGRNTEGGTAQKRQSVSDFSTTEALAARDTGHGQDGVVVPPKRTFVSTTCKDLLELRRKYLIQMSTIDCEYGSVDSRLLTHSPDALMSPQESAWYDSLYATRKHSLCHQQAVDDDDGGPPLYRDPPLYHVVSPEPIFVPRQQREVQRTKGRHRIDDAHQGLRTEHQGTRVNDGDVRHPDMYVTEFARKKHRFYYGPKADMLYPPVVRLSDCRSQGRRPQQSRSKTRSSDARRSHRTGKSAGRDTGRQSRPRVSSATNKG